MSVFLSVIIPSYNSLSTIKKSLASVISEISFCRTSGIIPQSQSAEIIVVDDGSTDESGKLLDDFEKEFSTKAEASFVKIKILHTENSGVASARNRGLDEASGTFIAFNDSDDMWLEGSLYLRLSILEKNPEAVLITGNHGIDRQIILGLEKVSEGEELYLVPLEKELFKNYYTVQNSLVRKAALENVRFKSGMRYAEEMYFFCQIARREKCLFLNQRLSQSVLDKERFGDCGLSGNLSGMEKGEFKCLNLVRKEMGVPFFLWFKASAFSMIKFVRRLLIVALRGKK